MKTYDRDIDYLGEIGRILRDLTGYSTLAYELIQNADDDGAATSLTFDVRDDALVVQHDGSFSDCGYQDEPPNRCPSYVETGNRCDLHSFRRVGGANKAQREDTTGAFGIGFTAVYQVTDRPELATAKRHWFIDETAARDQGIQVCDTENCSLCIAASSGTTLRLPWARDGSTEFRRETKSQPVQDDVKHRLTDELTSAVPVALIFLRRLKAVAVLVDGESRCIARRQREKDTITVRVETGSETATESFILIEGAFPAEAARLRRTYAELIEASRSKKVQIAVPTSAGHGSGRYYAYLPTEDKTELPVHINGDFFPNSERKHLVEEGFRGEWNAAILDAAARALAEGLPRLPGRAHVSTIWDLLLSAYQLTKLDGVSGGDRYWTRLASAAREAPILLTAGSSWVAPKAAYYLQEAAEQPNAVGLSMLGIEVAADEVAQTLRRGLKATELGLRQLTSTHLRTELIRRGLKSEVDEDHLPASLHDEACRVALLREVEILVAREKLNALRESALADAAVLPCTDGAWRSVLSVVRGVPPQLAFLESEGILAVIDSPALPGGTATELFKLCTPLNSDYLVQCLHDLERDRLSELMQVRERYGHVLLTLSRHRSDLGDDCKAKLAQLPIFPTANGLAPIDDLRLPAADFADELGLAGVLDLEGIEEARPLLVMLGAQALDFRTYITWAVPQAVENGVHEEDPATWSRLLKLLWKSASRIVDDPEMVHALAGCPVVPTSEAGPPFVKAAEAYFPTAWISRCLGSRYPTVALPDDARDAASQLLTKVGVVDEPRASHIFAVLDTVRTHPGHDTARDLARDILSWLGQRPAISERPSRLEEFQPLAKRAWLPAEGDRERWYAPEKLYSAFAKPLVESVGLFLDMPMADQQRISSLIDALGVQNQPSTAAIVEHLSNYARAGRPVSKAVYRTLNDRATNDDDAISIPKLRNTKCLLLPDGSYVEPSHVFASENPFGLRRVVLGDSFPYAQLLKAMRVKPSPDHEDAVELLLEVAAEYEASGAPLDLDDQLAVRSAWRILQQSLETSGMEPERLRSILGRRTCILLRDGRLATPGTVYIEDSPVVSRSISRDAPFGLIDRDELTRRAQQAAGVTNLSDDAIAVGVELSGSVLAPELRERWLELWPAIARVIDAVCDVPVGEALARLEKLEVSRVEDLAIQYRLRRYPSIINPVQRPGAALLSAGTSPHLYVSEMSHGQHDLPRELARYLVVGSGLVGVIPTLATVLTSVGVAEAHEALDAYDVPRLASVSAVAAVPSVLSDLAGVDEVWPDQREDIGEADSRELATAPDSATEHVAAGAAASESDSSEITSDTRHDTAGSVSDRSDEPSPDGRGLEGAGTAADANRPAAKSFAAGQARREEPAATPPRPASSSRSSGQLRSYVAHEPAPRERAEGSDDGRSEVDEAGVSFVVEFEKAEGRDPDLKPHHNRGFDIASRDPASGEVLTIEVKSVRGEWGARGAAMSAAQFRLASELGDRYWLYIVEYATNPERVRLWRIQDPANRVEQFFFDDGWEGVAVPGATPIMEVVEMPSLEPEGGVGRVPVFDLRGGLESPAGYFALDDEPLDGKFIVQIRGRVLADRYPPGTLVLIDTEATSPDDGDAVLVELPDEDPETGLALATRTWWEESDAVTLGGGPGTPPLALESHPTVVGLIVRDVQ